MTLDDSAHVSMREAIERAHAEDLQRDFDDWQEQRMLESEEAEAARWSGIFRQQAAEQREVHYADRPAIDARLFAVDGDLIETARRDAERHDVPGSAA